ncbi:MAG: tetratricopeptide repeat protein [Planctomycetota bacterium]|jgi:tetratricopeptide (TPR) repeat protein
MPVRYFNWKLAIVLVIGVAVLGVGAFGLRQWRKTNRADEGLVLGNKAYEERRWEEAAMNLGRYLVVERDDVPVLLKYADAQLKIRPAKSNHVRQAIDAYRTVLRLDRSKSKAALKLTEIHLGIGSPGEAELIARRQLEINSDPELRRVLALALIGQRKFKAAAVELKAIMQKHPEQILAYETLGQLIERRPEDFQDVPAHWFDRAVENNPSSALAYIVRAAFYRRSENGAKVVADLERAEKQDLSDSDVRLRLANELVNSDAWDKAEAHLAALQEVMPTDPGLWQAWARFALKSRSQEKMLQVAETGLKELSPDPWDFMLMAAELFIRCGKFEDANDCIAQLRKNDMAPAAVAFLQGLIAAEQGHLSEAVKHWRQSMESGNKSAQVRLALASALSGLGNTQSAILQLRTLVSENPGSVAGQLALAKLLAQTGNWAEALEHAATAMRLSPGNSEPALLHLRAEMQLLSTDPASQGQVSRRAWRDIQQRMSALEETSDAAGDIKLMKFRFALQQDEFARAEALVAELKDAGLSEVKVAMAEAELFAAQDKTDEAIAKLREAAEKFPDAVELVTYSAVLSNRQEDREKCEEIVKSALDRVAGPVARRKLGLLLAQFYVSWDQKDKAYTLLNTLAQKLPDDIPIKRRILLCEQTFEDSENAQRLVDGIKSLEGEDGWQWRYEQARVWFVSDDFTSRYARIVSLLQENIAANPNDQASRLLLAKSYERADVMQLALSTYRDAMNRSPDDLRVIIPVVTALYRAKEYDEADQIMDRASRRKLHHRVLSEFQFQGHLRRGELDSASGVLQDILNNDPNNQSAYLSLALLKMQQAEYEEASQLLSELKAQNPDSLPVTAAQIQLNIRQDKSAEAMRLSDELVSNLDNASAYVLRARTYATLGRTDMAGKDLERAVSVEPNSIEAWVAKSDFHRSTGRQAEAIADIKQALSLASDNIQIQKRAISLYSSSPDPGVVLEGRALLEKIMESNPEDVALRLMKVRSMLAEGTSPAVEGARKILRRITEDQPQSRTAWLLLGEIAIKHGQPGEAMKAALGGLADKPTDRALLLLKARAEAARSPILAIPTLKELHELDPNDVNAAIFLANTYVKTGDLKKAMSLLRKQLATSNGRDRRQYEIAHAVVLYKTGNEQEAENELDSLIESEPNDPGPLLALAQLLQQDEHWSRLGERIISWRQVHPEDNITPVTVAVNLQAIKNSQAKKTAEEILRTVLHDDPDSARAMGTLAILLQTTGRSAEAAGLYRRLLDLEPGNLIAINNLAWVMCEGQGKYREALELADRGLKIAPNYLDLIDTRGVVHYRLGECEKAVQDFTRCIGLSPSITPAGVATRFYLARAFAAQGQKAQAIQHLDQALKLQGRIGGLSPADLAEAQRLLKKLQEGS